jgi:hypothetical protein
VSPLGQLCFEPLEEEGESAGSAMLRAWRR